MAAVLANWGGYYRQQVYLREAHRLGFPVQPPHVQHAAQQATVKYPQGIPTIYLGLGQVKGLRAQTCQRILEKRPFHSLDDFLTRVDPRPQEVSSLARLGAFTHLAPRAEALARAAQADWRYKQPTLFEAEWRNSELPDVNLVEDELTLLGVSLRNAPLDGFVVPSERTPIEVLAATQGRATVCGVIMTRHRVPGAGQTVLEIDDGSGILSVLLEEGQSQRVRSLLQSKTPLLFEGQFFQLPHQRTTCLVAERVGQLQKRH
jgi:error-prone DNA polymerase